MSTGGGLVFNSTTAGIVLNDPTTQNPATVASGAYITNDLGAYNDDAVYGTAAAAWTFGNYGTIVSTAGAGVYFGSGGIVENGATGATAVSIIGRYEGVRIEHAAGSVTNYGTIAASYSSADGVLLLAGGAVTNRPGGLIAGMASGIGISPGGSVTNDGTVVASGTYGVGIDLGSGGVVTNAGTVVATTAINLAYGGAVTNTGAGLLYGTDRAVSIGGTSSGDASVTNDGTIVGGVDGVDLGASAAIVDNRGTIDGAARWGVLFGSSGALTNAAAGVITGYEGVLAAYAPVTVSNSGTIAGGGSDGVDFSSGGAVVNSGLITGTGDVVEISQGGSVDNDGTIVGASASYGVCLREGGAVTNGVGSPLALIAAYGVGVELQTNPGIVTNFGTIAGTGTAAYGVILAAGGTVLNSGTITAGGIGVELTASGEVLDNAGTIVGGGGVAVALGNGADLVVIEAGAVFGGAIGGFAVGHTIDMAGVVADSASYAGGTLTLTNGGTVAATLTLSTAIVDPVFGVTPDGSGGTLVEASPATSGGMTFSGTYTSGIVLANATTDNPATVASGGYVTNQTSAHLGDAVYGSGTAFWTFSNYGTIAGTLGNSDGVLFVAGGLVANAATGAIGGDNTGVWLEGGGSLTNFGAVAGTGTLGDGVVIGTTAAGGPGLVVNYGSITGANIGVWLADGGTVENGASGAGATALISGSFGVDVTTGAGSVVNFGTILGGAFNGVYLAQGGSVANYGRIAATGANSAVFVNRLGGVIANTGTIISDGSNGVHVVSGIITNGSGGLIVGPSGVGVKQQQGTGPVGVGTVINDGTIIGSVANGVYLQLGGSIANLGTIVSDGTFNDGVFLGAGGVVTNGTTGAAAPLIDGLWIGINVKTAAGTVANFATIESLASFSQPGGASGTLIGAGVILQAGGLVTNGAPGSTSALITGYALGLYIGGGAGIPVAGAVGTVVNYGTIASTGTNGVAAAAVELSSGGTITNIGTIVSTASNAIVVKGSAGATIANFGIIENLTTVHSAIYSRAGGIVTNAAGALIASLRTAISFNDTVGTTISFGTVVNAGTITSTPPAAATAGAAIYFGQGGGLTNTSTGLVAATRTGVSARNAAATIANGGTIVSTAPLSATVGAGVYLGNGGLIVNASGGAIEAERGAVGLDRYGTATGNATVVNSGLLIGNYGVAIATSGGTGNNTIVNYGTIIGTSGVAIRLGAVGDAVVLEPGSQLTGAIGNFHAGDTIDLPGVAANGVSYGGGIVTLTSGASVVAQLDVSTPYTNPAFSEIRDSSGGTEITVSPPPPANYTFITGFSKTNSIQSGLIKEFPSGVITGNTGLATPFDVTSDASGNNFAEISTSLTINVSIADVTNVFTLINAYAPPSGVNAMTVEFIGSLGTTQTFTLVYGTDVRDFYQGSFANTINGTTTQNAFIVSGVQDAGGTGNVNTGSFGTYVVDEQNFALDPAFAGQTLDQIVMTNLDPGGATPILLGVTAETGSGGLIVVSAGAHFVVSAGQTFGNIVVLSGGVLDVASGGVVSGVQIEAGGSETVEAGGSDLSTTIASGGFEDVSGLASGTLIIAGGSQTVEPGGVADGVVLDDAAVQTVSGTASGTVVSAGDSQIVVSGGVADATTVSSGGTQVISSGGIANASLVYGGGTEIISGGGVDVAAVLSGGLQDVFGTASAAAIASGGRQVVEAGGGESGTLIGTGGTLELSAGALANGAITFAGAGGVLQIDDTTMPTVPISGFVRGDVIDLHGLPFSAGNTVNFDPVTGALTVSGSGGPETLSLSGATLSGALFALFNDPQGGTQVRAVPPAPTALALGSDTGVAGDDRTDTADPLITGLGFAAGDTVTLLEGGNAVGSGIVAGDGSWSAFTQFLNDGTHTLTAVESDPFGDVGAASSPLAITIDTTRPTVPTRVLAVDANSAATAIGIAAPSDPDDAAATLTIAVAGLPNDGTVVLPDGITPVTVGEALTLGQLTGLEFVPTGTAGASSTFTYTVSDIAGNTTIGTAFLGINALAPAGSPALVNGLGGPEGFGPNELPPNDDGSSAAIDITSVFGSAGINFFGHNYTQLYINNNGNITFNGPLSSFTPGPITAGAGNPIIAPFWADVDTRGGPGVPTGGNATGSDAVWWDLDTVHHVFTVTWDDVGYFGGHIDKLDAFQLQLVDEGGGNFDIIFRYQSINWTTGDASGGSGGLGGTVARAGFSAGNGVNAFELPQSGNQAEMLDLPFQAAAPGTEGATGQAGVYEFQVINGVNVPSAPTGLALSPASDTGVVGDDITQVTTPVITGFGVVGDTVTLFDGGNPIGTGTVAGDGTWAVQAGAPLSLGVHNITATESDSLGNSSLSSMPLALTIVSPVTTLFGFVYTYTNGTFYTGTVADNGSFGLTPGNRTVTDAGGNIVGSYQVFAEGSTTRVAGTVVIDRVTIDGISFLPDQTAAGGINGSGGLGSEAGSITVNGQTTAFSDLVAPAALLTITTTAVIPPPNGDVITAEVNQIFADVLGRNPTDSEMATYSAMLAGGASPTVVRADLIESPEGQGDLNQLYIQIFNQGIDPANDAVYTNQIIAGSSLAAVQLILAQSPQAQADLNMVWEQVLSPPGQTVPIDGFDLITYEGVLASGGSLATVRSLLAFSPQATSELTQWFTTAAGRAPSAAELVGMEDQLAAGATQTQLQSALTGAGSAGGFTIVNAPAGDAGLTATPGTPMMFVFSGVAFGNDTIAGFDPSRDTVQLPPTFAADFPSLQSDISAVAGGTLITFSASQSILIAGVAPDQLGPANFFIDPPPPVPQINALPPSLPRDDFAGAGRSDVLWRNSGGPLVLWSMDGAAIAASQTVTYQGAVTGPDASWTVAGTGDFNGDGMADVLWRNVNGGLSIWTMVGSQVAAAPTPNLADPGASWSVAGIGDFTGDRMSDILWRNSDGNVALWEMNGAHVAQSALVGFADPGAWTMRGIGDFNGDGTADILWQDRSGNVDIWEMNGGSVTASGLVGYADPANWHIVGVGDFNGDGKSDILWQDTGGDVALWEMNGLSVAASAVVGFADPASWHVSNIGDYDGDGKSDILWRRDDGALSLWTMNGSVVTASQSPTYQGNPVAPDGTWHPVA